jgi:hypothetical protein
MVMLNTEQSLLQNNISNFIKSKYNGFYGVLGAAGTGKSFTICKTINVEDAIFLGATNKVCSVVKNYLINNGYIDFKVKTIDSFFKFRIKKDHNNKTVISHSVPKLDTIPKIVVIDEISLINNIHFSNLMKLKEKRKFILLGDNLQIPPIEEDFERDENGFKVSKIFNKLDYKDTLTIQNRQNKESGLYNFISKFRQNMDKDLPYIRLIEKYKNGNDILFYDVNSKELKDIIRNCNPVAVCHKNLTVLSFNWLIGSTRTNNKGYKVNELNIGDRVFFDSYYKRDNDTFYTSEIVLIKDIEHYCEDHLDVGDIKECTFNYKKLLVTKEDGTDTIVYVGNGYKETLYPVKYRIDRLIEKYQKKINASSNQKQQWALRNKQAELNTLYSDFKLGFAVLKKPFAITTHKSQGSTYDDVIIPIYDFANKNSQDVNQLLYVAISRAKKRLIFVNNISNFRDNSNRYSFTQMERNAIASTQNYKCNICEIELEDQRQYDIDHIIPIANGGKNTPDNLQAICKNCHKEKTKNEKYLK